MDIKNLINTTINQKPADFATTFKDLMLDRIKDAVEAKKTDLAQNMFNDRQEPTEEQPEEPIDA